MLTLLMTLVVAFIVISPLLVLSALVVASRAERRIAEQGPPSRPSPEKAPVQPIPF